MKINIKDLHVLVIEEEAIDMFKDFISLVKSTMDHPEYLGDFSKKDFISVLRNKGIILMFQIGNMLGAGCMMIPASEKDMMKMGLKYDYHKVMNYGPQAVFKDFRGNGIQKYMIGFCDKLSKDYGYEKAIITVHPDNTHSIENIEKSGFQYVKDVEFKRGIRRVYQKDL